MSYDVYIYHARVAQTAQSGVDLDEFEHPPIEGADMSRFLERLPKYGYREDEESSGREFIKEIGGCPVQVSVFATEIAFSVPYWDNMDAALAEALQDASELADSDTTALFDPQTEEWVT